MKKIQTLFLIGVILLGIHKIESFLQGEYNIDPTFQLLVDTLGTTGAVYASMFTFMVVFLLAVWGATQGNKGQLIVFALYGIILTHEIHHLLRGFVYSMFYPGSITGTIMFLFSFYYWKTWNTARREW